MRERRERKKNEKWTEVTRKAKTAGQVWEVVNRERRKERGELVR